MFSGFTLGIIEFRNLVNVINEVYQLDYSNFAFTAFCRRIEFVMQNNNIHTPSDLMNKIKNDKLFFEIFIRDIAVDETEMFRDPGLWRELRDTIIPKFLAEKEIRIWIPMMTSGDELFTLLIVLREMNLLDKVKVVASTYSTSNIERIKKGIYNLKKMDTNLANYKRYNGDDDLSSYYKTYNGDAFMDAKLHEHVEFNTLDILKDKYPQRNHIILFRDKMIYMNKKLQNDIVNAMHEDLVSHGYLLIGIKEYLEIFIADKKFVLENEHESIYRKHFVVQ